MTMMRLATQEKLFGSEWIQEYHQSEPDRYNFQVEDNNPEWGDPRPDISMNSDGSFVIVWSSVYGGDPECVLAKVYDSNGDQFGDLIDVVSHTSGVFSPSVALNDKGNFLVAWVDQRLNDAFGDVVYAKQFDLAGNVVVPEFLVSIDISGTAVDAWATRAACGDDRFIVIWSDDSPATDLNVVGQLYDADLDLIGPGNFPILSGVEGSDPYMFDVDMAADGDFVTVGVSGTNVYAVTCDSLGIRTQAWGDEILCNEVDGECNTGSVGVGMNDFKDWVIAWDSDRNWAPPTATDIYAQRYNAVTPQGVNFKVNDTVAEWLYCMHPSVGVGNDGTSIVTWDDCRNDPGSRVDIYAQIFDPNRNPVGANFRIVDFDQLGLPVQEMSEVAFLSPSRYAVCFNDDRNNYAGGDLGVWAQYSSFSFQASGEYKEISCVPLAYVSGGQSLPGTATFGMDHCNEIYENITAPKYFFELPFAETEYGEMMEIPFVQFGDLPSKYLNMFLFSPYALYDELEYSIKFNKITLPYRYELRFDHLARSESPQESIKLYDTNGVEIPKQYYQVEVSDSYRIYPPSTDVRSYGPFVIGESQVDCAKARASQGKNIWGEDWGTSTFKEHLVWEYEHPEYRRPTTSGDYDANETQGFWNRTDDGRYTEAEFEDFYVSEAGFWGQEVVSGEVLYTSLDTTVYNRGTCLGDIDVDEATGLISGECYPISILTSYKYLSGDDYYSELPKRITLLLPEFLCFKDGFTLWVEYNKFVRYTDHNGEIVEYFHPRYREIVNPRLLLRQNKDYIITPPDGDGKLYFIWIVEELDL